MTEETGKDIAEGLQEGPVPAEVRENEAEQAPEEMEYYDPVVELTGLRADMRWVMSRLDACVTTREAQKALMAKVEARDAEMADRKLMTMLGGLSAMREDFFRLCEGIRDRMDVMDAESVLKSFEAYSVDMENILLDCGVGIGPFPYEKLNTVHQRIVDVIPTDDEELNGRVAERLSDGYAYNGRVLLKEKVRIYRFSEAAREENECGKSKDDKEE